MSEGNAILMISLLKVSRLSSDLLFPRKILQRDLNET